MYDKPFLSTRAIMKWSNHEAEADVIDVKSREV